MSLSHETERLCGILLTVTDGDEEAAGEADRLAAAVALCQGPPDQLKAAFIHILELLLAAAAPVQAMSSLYRPAAEYSFDDYVEARRRMIKSRGQALSMIAVLARDPTWIIQALSEALDRGNEETHGMIVSALHDLMMKELASETLTALEAVLVKCLGMPYEASGLAKTTIDYSAKSIHPLLHLMCRSLQSPDRKQREGAARALGSVAFETRLPYAVLGALADAVEKDGASQVRSASIRALENCATAALRTHRYVTSAIARLSRESDDEETRIRLRLALANIRYSGPADADADTRVTSGRPTAKAAKRESLDANLLALVRTCLGWEEDTVSERRIHASPLYQKHRESLGLSDTVSEGTVRNHLKVLAKICGVSSLLELDSSRKYSRFPAWLPDMLRPIRRMLEDRVGSPDRAIEAGTEDS